ncbi:SRPBCC family protein [Agromyces atrinae]|uniref:Polyketide cyclase n=1 Tax=Agromyces atrinae TaxID=592376 RepID=A0A4Q2M6Y5_9MICO|nr:SRPBCC family protein [Agromyces atrinae]NYD68374.1 uncharacterized protein YndB with AHSA1/START domain [Agromyces atrinae]RXZ85582.1 polyketide cyclase [Agromyces atrinae]
MSNALTITAPEGVPFIDYVRDFDAPVAAVFQAHADPELVKKWLGPNGYEMEIAEWNLVDGGGYSYVHRVGDEAYAFRGVFHSVRENDLIIQTFEYAGFADVVSIESMTFEDLGDGRTRLHGHAVYPTQEARDGMVQSGMETGMSEGYDRLEELVR